MKWAGRDIVLGRSRKGTKIVLTPDDRATHVHVVGASGRGKSKCLETMIRQDITNGAGLCLIDPHGSLYNNVLEWCASHNLKHRKVRLCNPYEEGWCIGFNPLHMDGSEEPIVRVDSMVRACAQVWGGEDTRATPRLTKCLRAVFYTLMMNKLTLLEAQYLTTANDPEGLRSFLTKQITDETFVLLWQEFNSMRAREFAEEFSSTTNRLIEFLSAPQVRTIIGQRNNILDARRIMDDGDIILVNLQSGPKLSPFNTRLLGTLMVNEFVTKALTRPEGSRPFYLYIDECYQYLNEDIEIILDQTRKFGLHMTLSHQRLGQLTEQGKGIYNAVMAGAQTKVVFGLEDAEDARAIAENIYLGELDLEKPKHSFDKPTVVGRELEWLDSHAETIGEATTDGTTETASETDTVADDGTRLSQATARGTAYTEQRMTSRNVSNGRVQTYQPILQTLPTVAHTLEELYYLASAKLKWLPQATAIVKIPGRRSCRIAVSKVKQPHVTPNWCARFRQRVLTATEFVSPIDVVEKEIFDRQTRVKRAAKESIRPPEPDDVIALPDERPEEEPQEPMPPVIDVPDGMNPTSPTQLEWK